MQKRDYRRPRIESEKSFETTALACAKFGGRPGEPPGSWHFGSAYDTFTGHFGNRFGASESVSGSAGVGFGPGGTSASYYYSGLCQWVGYGT